MKISEASRTSASRIAVSGEQRRGGRSRGHCPDGRRLAVVAGAMLVGVFCARPAAAQKSTELVTVDSLGVQLPGGTDHGAHSRVAISGDGDRVVFSSYVCGVGAFPFDPDCPVGAVAGPADIFLRIISAGVTLRVSSDFAIDLVGNACVRPAISGDGNVIGFIECVSPGPGAPPAAPFIGHVINPFLGQKTTIGAPDTTYLDLSHDGVVAAFTCTAPIPASAPSNGTSDVYVCVVPANVTVLVSRTGPKPGFPDGIEANGASGSRQGPAISSDGRYIVFESDASDLWGTPPNGGVTQVYRADLFTGEILMVSQPWDPLCVPDGPSGLYGLDVSATGRYVVFQSFATNLRNPPGGGCGPVDPPGQIWVRDMYASGDPFDLVSLDESGAASPPFSCTWPRINKDASDYSLIDGRFVTYASSSALAAPAGAGGILFEDVYRRDRADIVPPFVELVSVSAPTLPAAGANLDCSFTFFPFAFTYGGISGDGSAIAFHSKAFNLVDPDATFGDPDVFVRHLGPPCSAVNAWVSLGFGLAGAGGIPVLKGTGCMEAWCPTTIELTSAAPFAPAMLFVSLGSIPVPFKGGTLAAYPPLVMLLSLTDGAGAHVLPFPMSVGVPPGLPLFAQYAVKDAGAVHGIALSNAITATTP